MDALVRYFRNAHYNMQYRHEFFHCENNLEGFCRSSFLFNFLSSADGMAQTQERKSEIL